MCTFAKTTYTVNMYMYANAVYPYSLFCQLTYWICSYCGILMAVYICKDYVYSICMQKLSIFTAYSAN